MRGRRKEVNMTDQKAALIAEDIHKRFGSLEVLKGVSVSANDGDVISMIGSSGSGKSTFLRCINFLETPDKGRIVLGGEEVRVGSDGRSADRSQINRLRSQLGFVFQSFNLWAHMTVLQNVMEGPVQEPCWWSAMRWDLPAKSQARRSFCIRVALKSKALQSRFLEARNQSDARPFSQASSEAKTYFREIFPLALSDTIALSITA